MRILLIASAYNSMTQRIHAELADQGQEVSVELALSDEVMRDGVRRYDPDLVIAPMLTTAIPEDIWSAWPCFIVHPGPMGDRGPSSLDWAIMDGAARWGVTVLQANAEMDAGDIWASATFALPGHLRRRLGWRTDAGRSPDPGAVVPGIGAVDGRAEHLADGFEAHAADGGELLGGERRPPRAGGPDARRPGPGHRGEVFAHPPSLGSFEAGPGPCCGAPNHPSVVYQARPGTLRPGEATLGGRRCGSCSSPVPTTA